MDTPRERPRWRIDNTISGVVLGEWRGENERAALEAMARDAGYADHAEACQQAPIVPGELRVTRLPEQSA